MTDDRRERLARALHDAFFEQRWEAAGARAQAMWRRVAEAADLAAPGQGIEAALDRVLETVARLRELCSASGTTTTPDIRFRCVVPECPERHNEGPAMLEHIRSTHGMFKDPALLRELLEAPRLGPVVLAAKALRAEMNDPPEGPQVACVKPGRWDTTFWPRLRELVAAVDALERSAHAAQGAWARR